MDQLIYSIDPAGKKTQYGWCTCGALSSLTDPKNQTTTWEYDLRNRLIQKTYADNTKVLYVYDPNSGFLDSRTDAKNQVRLYFDFSDGNQSMISYHNAEHPTQSVASTIDYNFNRLLTRQKSDWGKYTYTFNPYIVNGSTTPLLGGGSLQKIANTAIANSDITLEYDALGRTKKRSINGIANAITWSYDAMSRITNETNNLGSFDYEYIDNATGSSKGTTQLKSITYPNGQITKFAWYGNLSDQRLRQIANMAPSGATISQFSYRYDPDGQIKQWQQIQNNSSQNYVYQYDDADQLIGAKSCSGQLSNAYSNQYGYTYDLASNRASNYSSTITKAKISGTITVGDIITVTVKDQGLTGGSKAFAYTVVSGDTLNSIALTLATLITKDTDMQNLGINAVPTGNYLILKSVSTDVTCFEGTVSTGATVNIRMGITNNFVQNAKITGTGTADDILSIKVLDSSLTGGSKVVSYTVLSNDTLSDIANGLKNAINSDTTLAALGITALSYGQVVTLLSTSETATTYEQFTSIDATEQIKFSINQNTLQNIAILGAKTTGDTVSISVYDKGLINSFETINYDVLAGDTLTSIASNIADAINANGLLQAIGIRATSSGNIIKIQSDSLEQTTFTASTNSDATEIVTINTPCNNVQTVVVGGTTTSGDLLTITVYDIGLTNGFKSIIYTVKTDDTIPDVASGLANAISTNSDMIDLRISASSNKEVLFISSNSSNATTYNSSLDINATENLTITPQSNLQNHHYNSTNEIAQITSGGNCNYTLSANKALKSASINGNNAHLTNSSTFSSSVMISSGQNQITASASDGSAAVASSQFSQINRETAAQSYGFDANGNMMNDGVNGYEWDAEDRLIKISYPGLQNYSAFKYDSKGRNVMIIECFAGVITSTRKFVWNDYYRSEERDESGNIIKKSFIRGQVTGSGNHYYQLDHLGSTREITSSIGNNEGIITYDPFGRNSILQSNFISDFTFGGYFFHTRSGLSQAAFRFYNARLGRWLNRDPIGESDGSNLFDYIGNHSIGFVDPSGLKATRASGSAAIDQATNIMNSLCDCCMPDAAQAAACKKRAKDVVRSLKDQWNNKFSDFPLDSPGDKVGGHFCWDWAVYFIEAVNTGDPGNSIWTSSEVGMAGGKGSGKNYKLHYAARIGIKNQSQSRCSFMLDDGFLDGRMTHPPRTSWWNGTGYMPIPGLGVPEGAGK